MPNHWITLVPADPRFVPEASAQSRARDRLQELAPKAERIDLEDGRSVQFFDCGANLERVLCPACHKEISTEWWQDRMDEDYGDRGFALASYATPCCKATHTLNDLVYEGPACFGRFAISAMNPNIGKLEPDRIAEFESILGTPLRVVYRRL